MSHPGMFFFTEWAFPDGSKVHRDGSALRNAVGVSLVGVVGTVFGPYAAAGAGLGGYLGLLLRGTVT